MNRHLVIIAHTDDELVFMCPAMAEILRGADPVHIMYLTAGDAAKGETYWRSREVAIRHGHTLLRPPPPGATTSADLTLSFLRLADGMLQGEGSAANNHESLRKLWRAEIDRMHALDGTASWGREDLIEHLRRSIVAFAPTLLHTLNGLDTDPREHADHHATGLFAAAAAVRIDEDVAMRFYAGSNTPHMPANVTGQALAEKTAAFAAYARADAEIFNGRADWLSASIYAPMLERQYYTACSNRDLRVDGQAVSRCPTRP